MPDFDAPEMAPRKTVAVAIAIVRRGEEVLICQRKADAALGGLWEFPGGKIELGESPAAAAEREVREELGITVRAVRSFPPITHDYPHALIHLIPFLCDYVEGNPVALGCAAFKWVHATDLPRHPFPAANDTLLQVLATQLL